MKKDNYYFKKGWLKRDDPFEPIIEYVPNPAFNQPHLKAFEPLFEYVPPEETLVIDHAPSMTFTGFGEIPKGQEVVKLRGLAKELKELEEKYCTEPKSGLDSVDAMEVMTKYAARAAQDDPKKFIDYMNEVLIGKEGAHLIPAGKYPRIEFGDLGVLADYQDHSSMQMMHFWAYVNYGYRYPKDIAKFGNWLHETIEPQAKKLTPFLPFSKTGSQEDLDLGIVGYNIGQALSKGHLKPSQLSSKINEYLRTSKHFPY